MKLKLILFALIVFLLTVGNSNAALVGIRAVDTTLVSGLNEITVNVGDTFLVELFMSGLDATDFSSFDSATGLVGMGISVSVDNPAVAILDYTLNSGVPWVQTVTNSANGYKILGQVGFTDNPISYDHIIGEFEVEFKGPAGMYELTTNFYDKDMPFNFSMDNYFDFDANVTFGGLVVKSVPIPSTLLLLGGGICALVGSRRKTRR